MMPVRDIQWKNSSGLCDKLDNLEWLVTNGLGGYASGTVAGTVSRRYHGILVAALGAPLGRQVVFNHLSEVVRFGESESISLGYGERASGKAGFEQAGLLTEFRLEAGLPVWRFDIGGILLEKRVLLLHRQNTVHVTFNVLENKRGDLPRLELRPELAFRRQSDAVDKAIPAPYRVTKLRDCYEIGAPQEPSLPPLRLRADAGSVAFTPDETTINHVFYPSEKERGYSDDASFWSPGVFVLNFNHEGAATLIASTESWEVIDIVQPCQAARAERLRRERLLKAAHPELRDGFGAELTLAAAQFVTTPAGRPEEAERAWAQGDEVRTVMAGYHWFADWGRDTMISLEGLTLLTGQHEEAGFILHTYSHYVRRGLIPNMIPEGQKQKGGQYDTADATLWYFHALARYIEYTQDTISLRTLLPSLVEIVEHHFRGTDFHIHVDVDDGLLFQGEEAVKLTWMDAKVGDWVVTPRRGKAVEINALWFNALSLLANWLSDAGDEGLADKYLRHARRAGSSFNKRFWNPKRNCLFDIVDGPEGNDDAIRPNQVFAISLPHAVLDPERWAPVMGVVEEKLLTPLGLRSLSPDDPAYQPTYHGDRKSRDGAYHQGTVWPWLIGSFIDAWLKLHPADKAGARRFLARFPNQLDKAGMGTLCEIYDAEEPHLARGCIAQAWSVAEVLRAWVKTAL
jgi:predicted glycogen debranching enzyme